MQKCAETGVFKQHHDLRCEKGLQRCSSEHALGRRMWEGQKSMTSKEQMFFYRSQTKVTTFYKQQKKKVLDAYMIPGRSSRWPALHLQNRSSTNSNNVIFFALSYQQNATVTQRKHRVLTCLSLLRHNNSATDRQEGGGCEKGLFCPRNRAAISGKAS